MQAIESAIANVFGGATAPAAAAAAEHVTVFITCGTSQSGAATIDALWHHHPNVHIRAAVRDLNKARDRFRHIIAAAGSNTIVTASSGPAGGAVGSASAGAGGADGGEAITVQLSGASHMHASYAHAAVLNIGKRLQFVVHEVRSDTAADPLPPLTGVDTLLIVPPQGGAGDRTGMARAYAAAAKVAGVKLIAMISTPAVANPKLILAGDMAAAEQIVATSGVPYVFLRCCFFFENTYGYKSTLVPVDGTACVAAPMKADTPFQAVAVADIGECAANILAGACAGSMHSALHTAHPKPGTPDAVACSVKCHGNRSYWLGAEAMTHGGMTQLLSRVLNKPVTYKHASDADAVAALRALGWVDAMAKGLVELYHFYGEKAEADRKAGDNKSNALTPANALANTIDLRCLLNAQRAPTTFGQWLVASGAWHRFGGVSQRVFVAGAAGHIGCATVKALLHGHPHVLVHAGVRDQRKAQLAFAPELQLKHYPHDAQQQRLFFSVRNVDTKRGDDADVDAYTEFLKGIDTLVLVPPRSTEDRLAVAKVYLTAAKRAGTVKHVVIVSSPAVARPTMTLSAGLALIETEVQKYGLPYTLLRVPLQFENVFALGTADAIKALCEYEMPACDSAAKVPGIAVADIGEAVANVAAWGGAAGGAGGKHDGHHGKTYTLAGDVQSGEEQAACFSRVLGKPVRCVARSDEQYSNALVARGWPEPQAKGFVELYHGFATREFGADANDTAVLKKLLNEQREPLRFEQWLQPYAAHFALANVNAALQQPHLTMADTQPNVNAHTKAVPVPTPMAVEPAEPMAPMHQHPHQSQPHPQRRGSDGKQTDAHPASRPALAPGAMAQQQQQPQRPADKAIGSGKGVGMGMAEGMAPGSKPLPDQAQGPVHVPGPVPAPTEDARMREVHHQPHAQPMVQPTAMAQPVQLPQHH